MTKATILGAVLVLVASAAQAQYLPGTPGLNAPGLCCNAYDEQNRMDREHAQHDEEMRRQEQDRVEQQHQREMEYEDELDQQRRSNSGGGS